jgi:hypothetical protein
MGSEICLQGIINERASIIIIVDVTVGGNYRSYQRV